MRTLRWWAACLAGAVALAAGCAGNGEGLDENGRPLGSGGSSGALEPTIESIQDHVFTPRCASCHAGATAPQGLRLEDAQTSYDNLVNVRSTQSPTQFRVEPGNPDDSYLIDKLEGTQLVGERMPRGQPPLSADEIAVIGEWIADGAAPPGSGAQASAAPLQVLASAPLQDSLLTAPPQRAILLFTRELDATRLLPGTVTLSRDGVVLEPRLRLLPGDARSLAIELPAADWTPGRYALTVADGALRDLTGQAADGYELRFELQ